MIANLLRRILDFLGILPLKLPLTEVVSIALLSPSLKKIQLQGNFSKIKIASGSYLSFKLNYTQVRTYTIAQVDRERDILELIVYLHKNGGPGLQFINQLRLGDTLNISNLRANSTNLKLQTTKYVFFGDESSLGLALSLLAKWQKEAYQFLFLFELEEENKNIPACLGIEKSIVFSKNQTFRNERRINQLAPIQSNAWENATFLLTGNAKSIEIFKKVINDKTQSKVYTRAYWTEGIEGL